MREQITLSKANLLVELFSNYANTIYEYMMGEYYELSTVLDFIEGYNIVTDLATRYLFDIEIREGYDTIDSVSSVIFEDYNEINNFIDSMFKRSRMNQQGVNYTEWNKAGIKYAVSLAKFYTYAMFRDSKKLNGVIDLYIPLPEEDALEEYVWELL